MEDPVLNITKQFSWKPEIINDNKLLRAKRIIVAGMGGSHLSADLLHEAYPHLPLFVWKDYGLPEQPGILDGALCVASSYSGNTEETISFAREARERGLPLVIIAAGGELIKFAEKNALPYVHMPHTGIQPRDALGYSLLALGAIIESVLGMAHFLHDISSVGAGLQSMLLSTHIQQSAEETAKKMQGKTPVVYASGHNAAVAYIWKIMFNETGKIPAFYNILPEMNHNELAGFDGKGGAQHFHALFLTDASDHERITRRMQLTASLLAERGITSSIIQLNTHVLPETSPDEPSLASVSNSATPEHDPTANTGIPKLQRSFASIILGSSIAHAIARANGTDPNKVAIIEDLKHQLAQ